MSSDSKIRFSIVIPAFNEAHYIAATLDSLSKQQFDGKYEVIVVDNNSTDLTATIATSLGARVIKESHPGVCWARQAGTVAAKGEIVISTDADTTFTPDWLSKIDKKFKENKSLVAVAGPCRYVNGPLWGEVYALLLFGSTSLVHKLTRQTYYASATNIAFKKNAWKSYDTTLTQGGDELDLLRNLRKEGRIAFDNHNPTYTSARRFVRGFLYNFVVSLLIYYILEYNLTRLFKRPVLGSAPKFRNEFSPTVLTFFHVTLTIAIIAVFALYTHPGHVLVKHTNRFVRRTETDVIKMHTL